MGYSEYLVDIILPTGRTSLLRYMDQERRQCYWRRLSLLDGHKLDGGITTIRHHDGASHVTCPIAGGKRDHFGDFLGLGGSPGR